MPDDLMSFYISFLFSSFALSLYSLNSLLSLYLNIFKHVSNIFFFQNAHPLAYLGFGQSSP
jgi:hypothetical protein